MTDEELLKRLRAGTGGGKHWMDLHEEAADRIEALVNEAVLSKAAYEGVSSLLLSVQEDCIKERQRAERLEAALEKIIALDDTAECCGQGVWGWNSPPECCSQPLYGFDRAQNIARAALTQKDRTDG